MKIEIIDERSVAVDLLKPGGRVLDAGARGMGFTREMLRRQQNVIALDPAEPNSTLSDGSGVTISAALVGIGHSGNRAFADWDNGEGSCLVDFGGPVPERSTHRTVDTLDILEVMQRFHVGHWACVKMNCEGAEYSILETWPGPIADQITVSFHEHTGANKEGEAVYERILAHLGKWYDTVRHVREEKYCAGPNYWDSLFVLKGAK